MKKTLITLLLTSLFGLSISSCNLYDDQTQSSSNTVVDHLNPNDAYDTQIRFETSDKKEMTLDRKMEHDDSNGYVITPAVTLPPIVPDQVKIQFPSPYLLASKNNLIVEANGIIPSEGKWEYNLRGEVSLVDDTQNPSQNELKVTLSNLRAVLSDDHENRLVVRVILRDQVEGKALFTFYMTLYTPPKNLSFEELSLENYEAKYGMLPEEWKLLESPSNHFHLLQVIRASNSSMDRVELNIPISFIGKIEQKLDHRTINANGCSYSVSANTTVDSTEATLLLLPLKTGLTSRWTEVLSNKTNRNLEWIPKNQVALFGIYGDSSKLDEMVKNGRNRSTYQSKQVVSACGWDDPPPCIVSVNQKASFGPIQAYCYHRPPRYWERYDNVQYGTYANPVYLKIETPPDFRVRFAYLSSVNDPEARVFSPVLKNAIQFN